MMPLAARTAEGRSLYLDVMCGDRPMPRVFDSNASPAFDEAFAIATELSTMAAGPKRAALDVWLMRYFASQDLSSRWCVPKIGDTRSFVFESCWAFGEDFTGEVPLRHSLRGSGKTTTLRRVLAAFLCAKTASVYPARRVIVPACVRDVVPVRWHEPLPPIKDDGTLFLVDDDDVRQQRWKSGSTANVIVANGDP